MSSFKAIFKLDGNEYDVMSFSYSFGQSTDNKGRPASDIKAGLINLTLTVPGDSSLGATLMHWMLDAYGAKNGSIDFKRIDQDSTFRTISFEEAYCVSLTESFNANVDLSMNLNIGIAAKKVTSKDATYEKK